MALWDKTDLEASRPNWINLANYPAGTQLVFVDTTEANNETNRSKGIRAPGWHLYREYTDSDGQVRYKSELVVALAETAANAGDAADDLFVPDVVTTVTIDTQPTAQTTVAGAATFTVVASLNTAGTVTYQWQVKVGDAGWTNVTGETTDTLVLAGQTADNDGDMYRVVVAGDGAKAVTSDEVALTFGD